VSLRYRNGETFDPDKQIYFIPVFRRVRKIAKSDYQLRHVCLFVRMQQIGSHWTDFNDI
jgi:hypothetical protein